MSVRFIATIFDSTEGPNIWSIALVKSVVKVAIPHCLGGKVERQTIQDLP
jgi:hypothetical protein